jgi:methionyl-tRNA formyltransferase
MPSSFKNNKEEYEFLKELNPDIAIVVAYGQIIPKEILSLTKKGFINIHASLLPKWRGAAPIQRSIMNLDKETGISIMKINDKLDSGPVCSSYKTKINDNDNFITLSDKLSLLAAEKILDVLDDIMNDKIKFEEQDHSKATYANKIHKIEGKIDWNNSARKIVATINGLNPNPGAWFNFKGERYKILSAKISEKKGQIGQILTESLEIGCVDSSIEVLEIQREGKQPQKASEFMLGSKIQKGSKLQNE